MRRFMARWAVITVGVAVAEAALPWWARADRVQETSAALDTSQTDDLRTAGLPLGLGIGPDLVGGDGFSALAHAVAGRDEGVVRLLLEAGATPDVDPVWPHRSVLEQAVRDGGASLVGLLIAHGADPTVLSREGQPLLLVAAALGHVAVAEALLDAGADVDTEVVSQ